MKSLRFLCLITILIITACSSGKVAFEKGNYFQAVMTSVDRLRKNSDHKKSIETLRQAYPMAVAYYEDRAKASLAANTQFKWTAVVESYTTINVMYDEIKRSPGALKVIPNPVSYYAQLTDAKQNAAEENYAAGLEALAQNNREKAKQAHGYFKNANAFVPGYKDVVKLTEAALWAATLKVVMEPIPVQARNISVSAGFFDDKISEYLHSTSINNYVRFFTRQEAQQLKLNPDHIIKLEFDEFVVGQVFLYEKEMKLEKDSVVVGTYVAQSSLRNTQEKNPKDTGTPDNLAPPSNPGNTPGNTTTPSDKSTTPGTENKDNKNTDKKEDNPSTDTPTESMDEKDRVTVCHIPPGNEAARHTLVIAQSALAAHLAHGDVVGTCEATNTKGKPEKGSTDQKSKEEKGTPKSDDKKTNGKGGGQAWLTPASGDLLFASASNTLHWLSYSDTTKIYNTVKATLYYSRKTTTAKGVVSFKIIDAKTNALLAVEKMPGEYVWVSEWATFNGDERALTQQQLQLSQQKEKVPPPPQDLFIEFTRPIYDQVTTKIKTFYKNY